MDIILGDMEYNSLTQNIFGLFYIKADNIFFPYSDWTDFIYPVLGWWADEVVQSVRSSKRMKLLFMDGDYCIIGTFKCDQLEMAFYHSCRCPDDEIPISVNVCNFQQFVNSLISGLKKCSELFIANKQIKMHLECNKKINELNGII